MQTTRDIREGYVLAMGGDGKVPSRRFQRIRVADMDPPTAKLLADLDTLHRRKGDVAAAERIVAPIVEHVRKLWGASDKESPVCASCSKGLAA